MTRTLKRDVRPLSNAGARGGALSEPLTVEACPDIRPLRKAGQLEKAPSQGRLWRGEGGQRVGWPHE